MFLYSTYIRISSYCNTPFPYNRVVRYRNYNNGVFSLDKWEDPVNGKWIKPKRGGLWASPINSVWGWKDWCEAEEFYDRPFSELSYFDFSLADWARIYTIQDEIDLQEFKYGSLDFSMSFPHYIIDFEKAAEEYDAIFLTAQGEQCTRYTEPYSMYGWDCESILVLRKEAIENIESYEEM